RDCFDCVLTFAEWIGFGRTQNLYAAFFDDLIMMIHVWDLYHDLVRLGLSLDRACGVFPAQFNDNDRCFPKDQLTAMISDVESFFEAERFAQPGCSCPHIFI